MAIGKELREQSKGEQKGFKPRWGWRPWVGFVCLMVIFKSQICIFAANLMRLADQPGNQNKRTDMMKYVFFSLGFTGLHIICYVIAGIIDLQLAKKLYSGKNRLYQSFFRDMEDEQENRRIARLLLPSQFVRGLLMSVVLYPVLPAITQLSFGLQFLFFSGLMFIYADFASAVPFSNTIEGLVYLQKPFVRKKVFWTIQLESVLYSIMFGLLTAWVLI